MVIIILWKKSEVLWGVRYIFRSELPYFYKFPSLISCLVALDNNAQRIHSIKYKNIINIIDRFSNKNPFD